MPLRHVVALAGAHHLGRWWPEAEVAGNSTASPPPLPLITAPPPGCEGSPRFDNSYFTRLLDGSLPPSALEADAFLLADAETRLLVEEYAASEAAFFVDYAAAHDELSRLGMPRGSGNWHRQVRQEHNQQQNPNHDDEQQQQQLRQKRSGGGRKGRASSSSSSAAAAAAAAVAATASSPLQSASEAARRSVPPPPRPSSYWSSWPAIDDLATALGVSPGAAAAASAVVGTVAVLGGAAALVWGSSRWRRRRTLPLR